MDITSIRYINLEKDLHRNALIKYTLSRFQYPIYRCPGINYEENNPKLQKYLKFGTEKYLIGNVRKDGVIGCWISHSKALEKVKEKSGVSVILEDDFMCEKNFLQKATEMLKGFETEFDVIIFDPWGEGPLETHKIGNNIYRPKNIDYPYYGGTHCLFVNNASIPKILNLKLHSQVKDYDGYLFTNQEIATFVFYTKLCWSRNIDSNINKKSD